MYTMQMIFYTQVVVVVKYNSIPVSGVYLQDKFLIDFPVCPWFAEVQKLQAVSEQIVANNGFVF